MRLSSELPFPAQNNTLAGFRALSHNAQMTRDSDELRAAIRRFMKENDLKPKPWAEQSGVSEGTLRAFLSGENDSITYKTLRRLADSANVPVSELIGEFAAGTKKGAKDQVLVPYLRVRASLGGGVDVVDETGGASPFYFKKSLIDRVTRGKPSRLRVIELTGDSMEPTLLDGDHALVDLNATDVAGRPGIYCLWNGHGLVVKRVQTVPGKTPRLRIISDNAAYTPDEIDADEVHIIGRVIWISREV